MSKKRLTGSIQEKNGIWYTVINLPKKANGKPNPKWETTGLPVKGNKRNAEKILNERIDYYTDNYRIGGEVLFTDYLLTWLEDRKSSVEVTTWQGDEIYVKKHIIPYFEPLNLKLMDVTPTHISDYYNHKFKNGRLDGKSGGLTKASLQKHKSILKQVFDDAVVKEYIIRNPADKVPLPGKKESSKEYYIPPKDTLVQILESFKEDGLYEFYYFTALWGLRREEILGIKWDAIDFEKNLLFIKHVVTKQTSVVRKDSTKSKTSERIIQLSDADIKMFLDIKARNEGNKTERFLSGKSYDGKDEEYVFTNKYGNLYYPDTMSKKFKAKLEKRGFPKMTLHGLRHSAATLLDREDNTDVEEIRQYLGHSTQEMTEHYIHRKNIVPLQTTDKMRSILAS